MPAKRTKKPPADAWAWLNKTQAAAVSGYSVRNFTERLQPRLEASATRGKGAALRFDIRAIARALADHVREQSRPKIDDPDGLLDPNTPTGQDPVLDALRIESTVKLKLANAETRRELIDRQKIVIALGAGFAAAAANGKKLDLRFGREATYLWNEAMKAIHRAAVAALGDVEAPGVVVSGK